LADAETPINPSAGAPSTLEPPSVGPSTNNPQESSSEALDPAAKVCGNCRLFTAVIQERGAWSGDCKLMPDRGMLPATAPLCNKFLARAAPIPRALPKEPPRAERGRPIAPTVRRPDEPVPELEAMTREELKALLREALEETLEVRLAPKWEGGILLLKPAAAGLQPKEMPIDAFFHKVVMVRDRLRSLEQKVNSHPKLSDAEKVEMQQYVTRCYGSLTTFNLLFAEKDDQFVGEKGKGE